VEHAQLIARWRDGIMLHVASDGTRVGYTQEQWNTAVDAGVKTLVGVASDHATISSGTEKRRASPSATRVPLVSNQSIALASATCSPRCRLVSSASRRAFSSAICKTALMATRLSWSKLAGASLIGSCSSANDYRFQHHRYPTIVGRSRRPSGGLTLCFCASPFVPGDSDLTGAPVWGGTGPLPQGRQTVEGRRRTISARAALSAQEGPTWPLPM
jgi:hypothetical protein